jgi:hypothetical protein
MIAIIAGTRYASIARHIDRNKQDRVIRGQHNMKPLRFYAGNPYRTIALARTDTGLRKYFSPAKSEVRSVLNRPANGWMGLGWAGLGCCLGNIEIQCNY